MNKINLDTWIQLLGMLGVIASLIFVGLEMRQSQRIALVSQMQERSYTASSEAYAFTEANLDLSLIHISEPRDRSVSRMPSSA